MKRSKSRVGHGGPPRVHFFSLIANSQAVLHLPFALARLGQTLQKLLFTGPIPVSAFISNNDCRSKWAFRVGFGWDVGDRSEAFPQRSELRSKEVAERRSQSPNGSLPLLRHSANAARDERAILRSGTGVVERGRGPTSSLWSEAKTRVGHGGQNVGRRLLPGTTRSAGSLAENTKSGTVKDQQYLRMPSTHVRMRFSHR